MGVLETTIGSIRPADASVEAQVLAHIDNLTKPPGSLGLLEELALKYCLAAGTSDPVMPKTGIICFAGDHGVTAEGVSAFPAKVTAQMVANMTGGGAAINVLCKHYGIELTIVDMGVADDLDGLDGLCGRKVRHGTSNIAAGPAMTVEECRRAVETGIELACKCADDGIGLIGTGDMGIGNTTSSAALFCAYLDLDPAEVAGRGTGIDDDALEVKRTVIRKALAVNRDRMTDPTGILAALGGLETAGICGMILGAASRRMPVVVDGFISCAGALAACGMCGAVRDYLFFGHMSAEQGHRRVLEAMDAKPILNLGMRLGEGTGAALAMPVITAAIRIYREMATFSGAHVSSACR